MVDHNHDRINSHRRREIGDEVHRELSKGKRDIRFDWEQRGRNRVGVSFVLLADWTAGNEVLHEGGETQPPEVPFQDCLGVEDPHVSQKRGGVNRVEQGRMSRGGYKHSVMKIKMSIIKGPVGERGLSE